ncbi:MAG: tRNA (adenosine(37)-N6)-threonylcarbamoyltransferase complex transferase subunit TsaD [Ignavibacteria bacterium]|nr:tRNA (adenosine(37)-N6)-threonylcarbamoyltransferase complex transferase subunit TsaD [Ignavibacteria bacterium]
MKDIIFSIETSCDETSVSVLQGAKVLSNIISSQSFHSKYGGIVPELASRSHIKIIDKIATTAFKEASVRKKDITLVAATGGPGLIGSLLTGFNFAKAFALSRKIPFISIDHIESHIFSPFIGYEKIDFPFIALVVSGGHTILAKVEYYDKYVILGQTVDDAAGEAFDKAGKLLGLDYPAGPEIDRLAELGNENYHHFPEAVVRNSVYNFSFSGIKTSLLYFLNENFPDNKNIPINDISASFRKSVISSLLSRTLKACTDYSIKKIAISGGVSSNFLLRRKFRELESDGFEIYFPMPGYSTDNAAMIGYYAYLRSIYCKVNYTKELSLNAYPVFRS